MIKPSLEPRGLLFGDATLWATFKRLTCMWTSATTLPLNSMRISRPSGIWMWVIRSTTFCRSTLTTKRMTKVRFTSTQWTTNPGLISYSSLMLQTRSTWIPITWSTKEILTISLWCWRKHTLTTLWTFTTWPSKLMEIELTHHFYSLPIKLKSEWPYNSLHTSHKDRSPSLNQWTKRCSLNLIWTTSGVYLTCTWSMWHLTVKRSLVLYSLQIQICLSTSQFSSKILTCTDY